jgi:ribosomal protein L11 methyltransferase
MHCVKSIALKAPFHYIKAIMSFYEVHVNYSKRPELLNSVNSMINKYQCSGVLDYSIDESRVDEILGERAYSGGDVPEELIDEVTEVASSNTKTYFFEDKPEKFVNFINQLDGLEYEVKEQQEQDWNVKWREGFEPIEVSESLIVVPSWIKRRFQHKTQVRIYPGMGFGTGTHETTFLCLELLTELVNRGANLKTCFDFGCGSGILGIAHKLTTTDKVLIDFLDIDEEALTNTRQNLEINNIDEEGIQLLNSNQRNKLQESYRLIFANILQDVLHTERGFLVSQLEQNGFLIISGLLKEQLEETVSFYERVGIQCLSQRTKGDWAAALFIKS